MKALRDIFNLHSINDHVQVSLRKSSEHELVVEPLTDLLLFFKVFQEDGRLVSNFLVELSKSFSRDGHLLLSIIELVQGRQKQLLLNFVLTVILTLNLTWRGELVHELRKLFDPKRRYWDLGFGHLVLHAFKKLDALARPRVDLRALSRLIRVTFGLLLCRVEALKLLQASEVLNHEWDLKS